MTRLLAQEQALRSACAKVTRERKKASGARCGALACLLVMLARGGACLADSSDTGFANFAFASELGSGIYEVDGRTLQVYQLHPSYQLRAAAPRGGRPGIRLIFPVTVGFFNFQPGDLVHLQVPTQINALSLEPGVELDYWLNDAWHVYPYAKGGGTFASSTQINAVIFGAGIRSDFTFHALDSAGLWRAELAYAGVHYHDSDLPDDSFTRLRDGVELRRNFNWSWHERRAQLAPYAITDIYFNAPSGPYSGISARTVQFEGGLMFGAAPMWEIHGFTLPRIGVGYRVAGVLSGWRLVIGDPF
jgi:hypothetical protein